MGWGARVLTSGNASLLVQDLVLPAGSALVLRRLNLGGIFLWQVSFRSSVCPCIRLSLDTWVLIITSDVFDSPLAPQLSCRPIAGYVVRLAEIAVRPCASPPPSCS